MTMDTERQMKIIRLPALREADPEEQPVQIELAGPDKAELAQRLIAVSLRVQREQDEAEAWYQAAKEARQRANARADAFNSNPDAQALLAEYLLTQLPRGKKSADIMLDAIRRPDIKARLGARSQPAQIEVTDEAALFEQISSEHGEQHGNPLGPFEWVPPTQGYYRLSQPRLREEVKARTQAGTALAGVNVIQPPDKLYVQDLSKQLPSRTIIDALPSDDEQLKMEEAE